MNHSFIIKNIRKSLIKSLVFPMLLLLLSLGILCRVPWVNHFFPTPLRQENHFNDFYNPSASHVHLTPDKLQYSGYNYVVNGKVNGSYYYTLINGFCQFYLLDNHTSMGAGGPSEYLENLNLRGLITELDDIEYKILTDSMAKDLGWSGDSLRLVSSQYAFSMVNHFPLRQQLLIVLLVISLFLSSFDLVFSILYIIFPLLSPTFYHLGRYGECRTLLSKVEMEMKHTVLAEASNIFLTPNYLVNVDTVRSIILPLNSVAWVYYHGHFSRLFGLRLKLSYTLHIVAINGKSYEFTKKKQENLDYILEHIKTRFPDILIGYSEASKQECRQRISNYKKQIPR